MKSWRLRIDGAVVHHVFVRPVLPPLPLPGSSVSRVPVLTGWLPSTQYCCLYSWEYRCFCLYYRLLRAAQRKRFTSAVLLSLPWAARNNSTATVSSALGFWDFVSCLFLHFIGISTVRPVVGFRHTSGWLSRPAEWSERLSESAVNERVSVCAQRDTERRGTQSVSVSVLCV